MNATPAPSARCCALATTIVLLLAAAQLVVSWHGRAPGAAAIGAAWAQTGATGAIGSATLTDTAASPGASCRFNRVSTPPFVDLLAAGPMVSPAPGNPTQPVAWRAVLAQVLPDSSLSPLATTAYVTATASTSQPATLPGREFLSQPLGPAYVVLAEIVWYDPATPVVTGAATYRIGFYRPLNDRGAPTGQAGTACRSPVPPTAFIPTPRGTVNGIAGYTLAHFPIGAALAVTWDGKPLGTVTTAANGALVSSFTIPATPLGYHTVRWSAGSWSASAVFEVVPRIKVTPGAVSRGQTVNVSLRGFAKKEVVRIRWKRGGSYVELARVLTSNTGSANVTVPVPSWAADGATSVRGDGPTGRAQTNAVTVQGGAFRAADEPATPTPTAPASPTPIGSPGASPVSTSIPLETATPAPSPTLAIPDATPPPDDEPTPIATATQTPTLLAEPTPAPSDVPTETPSPTATPSQPTPEAFP